MVLDIFKGLNLTPGQEVRAQDIKDLQNFLLSRLMDQMFERLVPGPAGGGIAAGSSVMFNGAHGANVPSNQFAYALSCGGAYPRKGSANTKIQIAPGTLFQKTGTSAGDVPTFLPYTFAGTDEVTIANGDATNPRVDLVQMSLALVDDDSQARVTATAGVKASRDLNPLTTNCETVIRARAAGFGGNAISIQFVADGAGVGSLTQNGYALTFHYQTGVTTVANFETAVAASPLIEVQTVDGVGTLASPGDTFGQTFLTGGTDQVLSSSNLMMKRRVQMTLSVKQGTPAATPTFPTADSGYVAIAAIIVPATWTGAAAPVTIDHTVSANSLVIYDERMPIGTPRAYHVWPKDMLLNTTEWAINTGAQSGRSVANTTGTTDLLAVLRMGAGGGNGSGMGRLLAVEIGADATGTAKLIRYLASGGPPSFSLNDIANVSALVTANGNEIADRLGTNGFETNSIVSLPGGSPIANSLIGPPVWTNGRRAVQPPDGSINNYDQEALAIKINKGAGNINVFRTTFIVAEGL